MCCDCKKEKKNDEEEELAYLCIDCMSINRFTFATIHSEIENDGNKTTKRKKHGNGGRFSVCMILCYVFCFFFSRC